MIFANYKPVKFEDSRGSYLRIRQPYDERKLIFKNGRAHNKTCDYMIHWRGRRYADNHDLMYNCEYFGFRYGGTDLHLTNQYIEAHIYDTYATAEHVTENTAGFVYLQVVVPGTTSKERDRKTSLRHKWLWTLDKETRGILWWIVTVALLALGITFLTGAIPEMPSSVGLPVGIIATIIGSLFFGSIIFRFVVMFMRMHYLRVAKKRYKQNGGQVKF